jgi:hypothetical protein
MTKRFLQVGIASAFVTAFFAAPSSADGAYQTTPGTFCQNQSTSPIYCGVIEGDGFGFTTTGWTTAEMDVQNSNGSSTTLYYQLCNYADASYTTCSPLRSSTLSASAVTNVYASSADINSYWNNAATFRYIYMSYGANVTVLGTFVATNQ